jgi:SH3-like domain-containing protein
MTEELQARNAQRQAFLRSLYERVDSSVTEFVSAFEIGEAMGLSRAESSRIVAYLEEKALLKVDDHASGMCRLTADGVDRVELAG